MPISLKLVDFVPNLKFFKLCKPVNAGWFVFQLTMEGLCGDAANRWFDKTLQLVIFKNGTITCNGDVSVELPSSYLKLYPVRSTIDIKHFKLFSKQIVHE
jgi:hypothetical protein